MYTSRNGSYQRSTNKDSKKFIATNDFSIYDPMLKYKVRYKNDKGNGGRPSELINEMQDMI